MADFTHDTLDNSFNIMDDSEMSEKDMMDSTIDISNTEQLGFPKNKNELVAHIIESQNVELEDSYSITYFCESIDGIKFHIKFRVSHDKLLQKGVSRQQFDRSNHTIRIVMTSKFEIFILL